MNALPHICNSTNDVRRLLSSVVLPTNGPVIFMKIDVKNFYMSGSHEMLEREVSGEFKGNMRRLMGPLISFVLLNQYVVDSVSDAAWQVTCGSGMGQRHSSSISDLALFTLGERSLLSAEGRTKFSVLLYARYRDDVLAMFNSFTGARGFLQAFKDKLQGEYVLESETSLEGFPFLDLYVYRDGSSIRWAPYTKPTARHVPLNMTSAHPPTVHRAWPINEMARLFANSQSLHAFEAAREAMLERWLSHFMDPGVIVSCREWCPRIFACTDANAFTRRSEEISREKRTVRVVIPYSPVIAPGLRGHVLRAFMSVSHVLEPFCPVSVDICWRNGGRKREHELRSVNRDLLGH